MRNSGCGGLKLKGVVEWLIDVIEVEWWKWNGGSGMVEVECVVDGSPGNHTVITQ